MVILAGLEAFLEPLGAILAPLGVILAPSGVLLGGKVALARAGAGFSGLPGGRRGRAQVRPARKERAAGAFRDPPPPKAFS